MPGVWTFMRSVSVAVVCLAVVSAARADDFVNRVNEPLSRVPQAQRSDVVILPLAQAMDAPPAAVDTPLKAARMFHTLSAWKSVEDWANKPAQRAVIDALDTLTKDEDPRTAKVFAQPYGVEGVPVGLVRAQLYTELGDPPMLARARIMYLPALERVSILVHVEATRRAAAGDVTGAIDVLIDWLFFCRQIADRPFFVEKRWAMVGMIVALERVRDVAYTDFRAGAVGTLSAGLTRKLDPEALRTIIRRLEDRRGFLRIDRITFPTGDREAAEQLVAKVFTPRAGPNESFGETLARLGSTDKPLRLFAETSRWQMAAGAHRNWFDTTQALKAVYDDWLARWDIDPFSARMSQKFEFEGLSPASDAVLRLALTDSSGADPASLFRLRQMLRTEVVGTRAALGLAGFVIANNSFPRSIAAIRPRFMDEIEADPYNPRRERGAQPPMEYFVPGSINARPTPPGETPRPHTINIVSAGIDIRVGTDQFVLFSVGTDGAKNWADKVENTPLSAPGADVLIWPPIISLVRQHQVEKGLLK